MLEFKAIEILKPMIQRMNMILLIFIMITDILEKIYKLVAIKVDRLTRNNYGGFWLLNYCEEDDVKVE